MLPRRRRPEPRPAARPGCARRPRCPPGWQVVAAPADAVVFQGAAHAVVGHGAVLQADAAARAETQGKERAELTGAAVGEGGPDGLAVIPVRREGGNDRVGVTSVQRGLVATDDITRMGGPGLEDGRPQVVRAVMITSAPSARARRAVWSPMPALPPITTTVCPASSGSRRVGTGAVALVMIPPMGGAGDRSPGGRRRLRVAIPHRPPHPDRLANGIQGQ